MNETLLLKKVCSCDGCEKPAKGLGLCSMHYTRQARYGTLERTRKRTPSYIHTQGYVVEHAPDHPLSNSAGEIYQHRRIFFDLFGEGPFNCFGCSQVLIWSVMQIDHIDEVKSNNDPSNLRPACSGCNTRRSRNRMIETKRLNSKKVYRGRQMTLSELATIKGMTIPGMASRLKKLTVEQAMDLPFPVPNELRQKRKKKSSQ
ncbi:HNH endonuclease signature motif containing protein [Pseudomonas folii]|uniref:HNH endonuclease n=1 Tax=Pseudomonas folii TaxID=2762593 RepID=A0ABR7ATR5_9PSED|nr:HNH endonuclease signature motif containing protein [Pseudomonas folii]MBC3948309.1 HNH endonuclease [Pseudomonas folii]